MIMKYFTKCARCEVFSIYTMQVTVQINVATFIASLSQKKNNNHYFLEKNATITPIILYIMKNPVPFL